MGTFNKIIGDKINTRKSIISNIPAIKRWRIYINTEIMNFKYIILSESIQTQKATYYKIWFIWHHRKDKTTDPKIKSVAAVGKGWGERTTHKGTGRNFWGDKHLISLSCRQLHGYMCFSKFIELYTKKREFNRI